MGQPKDQEAGELQRRGAQPRDDGQGGGGLLEGGGEEEEDGLAADPRLDAEPAAADEGAEEGGDVGTADAEGGAGEDREGDAVPGAWDAGEDEGEEDDEVGKDDGGHTLPPGHAEVDEAAGEVVGGNSHDEANPEASHVPGGEGAGGGGDGGKVGSPGSGGIWIGSGLGHYSKGRGRTDRLGD